MTDILPFTKPKRNLEKMFIEPEPRPQPDPDLAYIIEEMTELFDKYITFTDQRYAFICALWCAQTWLFMGESHHDLCTVGYLTFVSPVANCGKTNALNLVARLSYGNPSVNVSAKPAYVFRTVEKGETLVLDELDGIVEDSDLISVLNGGYKAETVVTRMVGAAKDTPKEFPTFSPKAMGYIRDAKSLKAIKGTLESRCIRLFLKRRTSTERKAATRQYIRKVRKEAAPIALALARWQFRVPMVESDLAESVHLEDFIERENEIWESVFLVAYWVGRLDEAQAIAVDIVQSNREEMTDDHPDHALLHDLKANMDKMCDEDGFSLQLAVEFLLRMDDRPAYKREDGKWKMNTRYLGQVLSKYGLRSRHTGLLRKRRIDRRGLEDVFTRYFAGEVDEDD